MALGLLWKPTSKHFAQKFLLEQLPLMIDSKVKVKSVDFNLFPPSIHLNEVKVEPKSGPITSIDFKSAKVIFGLGAAFLGHVVVDQVVLEDPLFEVDVLRMNQVKSDSKQHSKKNPLEVFQNMFHLKVNEFKIIGAKLALKLPGENIEVKVDQGQASYEGAGSKHYLSWNGSGKIYRFGKELVIDEVNIALGLESKEVVLKSCQLKGLGAQVTASGLVYPQSNILITSSFDLKNLFHNLFLLGVLKKPIQAQGEISNQGKITGAWEKNTWVSSWGSQGVRIEGRKVKLDHLQTDISQNNLRKMEGEIVLENIKLNVKVNHNPQKKKGFFEVRTSQAPFEEIERLIDPNSNPTFGGPLDIHLWGTLGQTLGDTTGQVEVFAKEFNLLLEPHVRRFIPVQFKNLNVAAFLGKTTEAPFAIHQGKIQAEGLKGDFKINFLEKNIIKGVWSGQVSELKGIMQKPFDLKGEGKVNGGVDVDGQKHEIKVGLAFEKVQYKNLAPTELQGTLLFRKKVTELKDVVMKSKNGKLTTAASFFMDPERKSWIESAWNQFDLSWISHFVHIAYPEIDGIEGDGTGELKLHDLGGTTKGHMALESHQMKWKSLEGLTADVFVEVLDSQFHFTRAYVGGEGTTMNAQGVWGSAGFKQFNVETKKLPLSQFEVSPALTKLWPEANVKMRLDGAVPHTHIDLSAVLKPVERAEKRFSPLWVTMSGNTAQARLVLKDENSLDLKGEVNLREMSEVSLDGAFHRFDLTPFMHTLPTEVSGEVRGLKGSLKNASDWNGYVLFTSALIKSTPRALELKKPSVLEITQGEVWMKDFELFDRFQSNVVVHSRRTRFKKNTSIEGVISVDHLKSIVPSLNRAEGWVHLEVNVDQSKRVPEISGTFKVEKAVLQFNFFPHAIDALNAKGSIDQNRLVLSEGNALIGNGKINLAGGLLMLDEQGGYGDYALTGDVQSVHLRFPSWLPAKVSGNLALVGKLNEPKLQGDLKVLEAQYQDEWDWESQVLDFRSSSRTKRIYSKKEETFFFDLHFNSEGGEVTLRNRLAKGKLFADLRLKGSDQALGLVGRVDVLQGTVEFMDNKFNLSSGVVSFNDEHEIIPIFDLNAQTHVGQTDIFLDIRTEKDEVQAFLTSLPVKDETNIIALLTLGADPDESLSASSVAGNQIPSSLVPGLLSSPVQSKLQKGLRETNLIDTLQFVPYFSEKDQSSSLRMIVGKELFQKFRLLYSTDIFDVGTDNTVRLQQDVNEHLSIQGNMRDNQNQDNTEVDLGVDLEFKFDF